MTLARRIRWSIAVAVALASTSGAAPPNDDCVAPYVVTLLPFQHTVDTTTATPDPSLPPSTCFDGGVSAAARTVWYAFTAPSAMTLAVDTFESYESGAFPTTSIEAYRGACGALEQIACNVDSFDDYYGQYDLSYALVSVQAGETVLIRVFEDSGGAPVTVTFREVPMFQASTQDPEFINGHPAVAMQPDGSFLMVWRDNLGDTFPRFPAVTARRYDAAGAAQGEPYAVNTVSAHGAYYPEIDVDGLDRFVVAWGGFVSGVRVRRLDASGAPLGAEIAIDPTSYN